MKQTHNWKIRVGAFCLTALCLGTGVALAAGAGSESDPLVTLSYLNETVLPKLKQDVEASAETRQAELTTQFNQIAAQGGGGTSASYTVVTLNPGQRMNLDLGAEVMLRVGSAAAGAAVNPALVDVTTGGNLNSGEGLVQNHLYMATMGQHGKGAGPGRIQPFITKSNANTARTQKVRAVFLCFVPGGEAVADPFELQGKDGGVE